MTEREAFEEFCRLHCSTGAPTVSLDYIRGRYSVAIKRGMRVEYCGSDNIRRRGRVCGAAGPYISVRLDDERRSRRFHPTDPYLIYLPGAADNGEVG